MKIGTRLIILLTLGVNIILVIATVLILRQTEKNLMAAARDEIRSHAATLRIAIEEDYAREHAEYAQQLINRLSENNNIFGAILFNAEGQIEGVSNSLTADQIIYPNEVKQVLQTRRPTEVIRQINNQDVFSVIAPILNGSKVMGAIEIAQPISFVRQELAHERRNIALTAAFLSLMILAIASLVLHFNLTRPVQALLHGAIAIGKGDWLHRVSVPRTSGEFVRLAAEFNHMAQQLAAEREALARETEEKLGLERKLRHHERLAALGRLAAGVAHEVGAPLQVIDGRAKQLLERQEASLEARQRNLTIIRSQTERITRIIRQMLNLSRPYRLQRQPTSLRELILEVTEAVELSAARHRVQLVTHCTAEHFVAIDSGLILQALLNICQNAIQAMPGGGQLTLECPPSSFNQDGTPVMVIRISDTGPGIPLEHLEHIFDPFYTTKEIGHGTGLGLAVSSRIVEEHGGQIEVANTPTGGAVFTVSLPQTVAVERQS